MRFKEYVKTFVDDFKAHRRGEKRVAPRHVRGRVYAKKSGEADDGVVFKVKKEPVATLTMKVTRENGTVEVIKVPAQVTTSNG